MSEMVSISEAAKRLGIQRPTLSRIIKTEKIETRREGKRKLVRIIDCQNTIQEMSATGKLRLRTVKNKTKNQEDGWKELYQEMKRERDQLKEHCRALESENLGLQGKVKLLKSGKIEESLEGQDAQSNIFHKLGNAWNLLSN